jgi:hypothetical protein
MAHLWNAAADGSWAPAALDDDAFVLGSFGVVRLSDPPADTTGTSAVMLRRASDGFQAQWSLLIPPALPVLVNGAPAMLGIVVLADRDEIRLPGSPPLFFSTETLAAVAPFPTDAARGFCPRCRQTIAPNTPAVRCPGCEVWYHESGSLGCWSYADRCVTCGRPTPLDTGFSWTPAEV